MKTSNLRNYYHVIDVFVKDVFEFMGKAGSLGELGATLSTGWEF